ncbi:MAG: hypothetical protein DRP55_02080 [Spirochaetes bacterium]|nr:MAG: hypothetical protein DRP55_02080 [Spirochaetota bacterium]
MDLKNLKELANALHSFDKDVLRNYRITVGCNFLGPRDAFRELRLIDVEENLTIFGIHFFKLTLNGIEFRTHVAGIELTDNNYLSLDATDYEDWENLLKKVLAKKKPRIILDSDFRNKYGLPTTIAEQEIFILTFEKVQTED